MPEVFQGLARLVPGYRRRPSQVQLADRVMQTVTSNGILLAEAGVGTGKTMAYLLPIIESIRSQARHGTIVVTTRTISLQEQVVSKDLPVVARFFETQWRFKTPDVVLSKGKRNYFCRERFAEYKWPAEQEETRQNLEDWSHKTHTGDLSDPGVPYLSDEIRESIAVEVCTGESCSHYRGCQYAGMVDERRQKGTKIVVTNHNQFVQHLRLRLQGKLGLWPQEAAVVIDEAHGLEAVARQELAYSFSFRAARRFASQLQRFSELGAVLGQPLQQLRRHLDVFEATVERSLESTSGDGQGQKYAVNLTRELADAAAQTSDSLDQLVESLDIAITRVTHRKTERLLERLSQKGTDLFDALRYFQNMATESLRNVSSDLRLPSRSRLENFVAWAEVAGRRSNSGRASLTLVVAPLDVADFLRKALWSPSLPRTYPVVLTSGTMQSSGSFVHIRNQLGIPAAGATEFVAEPLFNYADNVRIYIPDNLPEPRPSDSDEDDAGYILALAERMRELVMCSRGRALLLFTSYRRMDAIAEYLRQNPIPYRVLIQGKSSPGALLQEFRLDTDSVLLATGAFWEGVDVAGEALSLVVMDKLPFPVPSDPLIKGLCTRVKGRGGDQHQEVLLPIMLTALQQGSGRLVRQEGDAGVIALLDVRALKDRYRDLVRQHLPRTQIIQRLEDVRDWYVKLAARNSK